MTAPATTPPWLLVVALAGSLAAVVLRVVAALALGPLWRDEAGSASTATVGSFAEFWSRQHLDSFPLLWQLVLRVWTTVLWDGGDAAIRALGLIVALLLVPALWWTSRALRVTPLASLLFAGVAPLFVIWAGVQNRAYGFGVLLLALLVGAVWRVVESPTRARVVLATLLAIGCVHTTYHLPVMLAALLGAAAVVGLRRRQWSLVLLAAGIVAVAAASLLPYAGVLERTRRYAKMVYGNVTFDGVARALERAIGEGGGVVVVAFGVLGVAACVWGMVAAWRALRAATDRAATDLASRDDAAMSTLASQNDDAELVTFAATAALLAVLGQLVFLFVLRFLPQPWYYATAILVVAIAIDVLVQRGVTAPIVRNALCGALALLLVPATIVAFGTVDRRQSNLDLVAAYLEQNARPGDLIVVYPWHYGVSFARYYDGVAPFMTIPDVAGHDYHRFDQLEELMLDPERIKPGYRRIYQTLQAGNGVWVVGRLPAEVPAQFPVPAVPRDDDPASWRDGFYTALAGLQLGWVLQQSSPQAAVIPPLTEEPVSDYENAPLTLYSVAPR